MLKLFIVIPPIFVPFSPITSFAKYLLSVVVLSPKALLALGLTEVLISLILSNSDGYELILSNRLFVCYYIAFSISNSFPSQGFLINSNTVKTTIDYITKKANK